ncbi:trigger factor [Xylocopilactobacillus apis]|uniref:Trigger factor n=1 Tax=Xylocopilactobacillus apis TaxID=2932183 RepID=A0AAU9DN93_9LACO|nr:trigger factor [Xylocopilactobacillus apis]BDR57184.1 trigger factor [Xylocopilactobacillus apis]
MEPEWEKTGTNEGTLKFEVSTEEVSKAVDHAFNKVKNRIQLPGFRKGKVTRELYRQFYGDESLYQSALEEVFPDAYEKAYKKAEIEPVGQPEVTVDKMNSNEPWVLEVKVTVKPEVKLGKYKGVEVKKIDRTVTDKDVDDDIQKRREKEAELVLKDGAAEKDDTVVIDYVGTIDGKEFDGGSAKNYSLVLGSDSFIPGFEDQLIGHKAEEDVDVNVTFPKDYQAKDLAGKEAHFAVKIHEVKSKELPALDDDFAKDLDLDVKTVDELKEKIKSILQDEKNDDAEREMQDEAIHQVLETTEIEEVPQVMIDNEVNQQIQRFNSALQTRGLSMQMYQQITGTSNEDLRKQYEEEAQDNVKTNLVLEAVVKAENIKPTKEDIDNEIKELADEYKMDVNRVRQTLTDDMLVHDIGIKKAIDVIVESAKEVEGKDDKKDSKEKSEDQAEK